MSDVWPVVHAERQALAALLSTLDDAQWETPSWCAGWTVHDVVAHVVSTAQTTRLSFVVGLVRARFDFDRDNANGVARSRGATPAETLDRLRAVACRTSTPPASLDTRLVEAFVHGEDIRRPLGATGDYPLASVVQALRYQLKTTTSFGGGKEHAAGLTLVADDADLSAGTGPVVSGPALGLLLAVSGRAQALADLDGPGVAELGSRLER
jgi:uncharacterized protein (TIGR03083 family)